MHIRLIAALSGALVLAGAVPGFADEYYSDGQQTQTAAAPRQHWWSGDWYLTLGAKGFVAPRYEGAKDYLLRAAPVISLGRAGAAARFSSLNDNASIGLIDTGVFRTGITGKLITGRDSGDAHLKGVHDVDWGVELGGFAEFYPTDNIRGRVEVRRGIGSHDGVVADFAIDAFTDLTPTVRVSAGPRATLASKDYFQQYYGVNQTEAAASGLSSYKPSGGGLKSLGVGGQITWKTTEKIETSAYAEYSRLMGPASDSSIVKERGSANQATFGLQATYRFDFGL